MEVPATLYNFLCMYLTVLIKLGGLYLDGFLLTLESTREASSVAQVTAGWIGTNIMLDNGTPTSGLWPQPVLLLLDILEWVSVAGTNAAGTNRLMGIIWHIECLPLGAAIRANSPGVSEVWPSFWSGKNTALTAHSNAGSQVGRGEGKVVHHWQ